MPPVTVISKGPPRPSVQGPRSSTAPVQPNAPEALSPGPSPVLPQQSGGEATGPRPAAASSNTDAKIAALMEQVAKLARSVEELHWTQAPLATVTREPITTPTQGETSTTSSVPLARFAGTKAGTDAQGRAPSASQHFLNDRYAASWDLLCLVTDEKSKQFRENLGYVELLSMCGRSTNGRRVWPTCGRSSCTSTLAIFSPSPRRAGRGRRAC